MGVSQSALELAAAAEEDPLLPVVGQHNRAFIQRLRTFARQNETILISGPSGSGKSRLAEWCHAQSPRRGSPFKVVDLLSVPEEMQMAELFGWRKGAFTGALRDQDGCIVLGEGGTLFIDEIDKLSLKAQAGLLQILETRRYRVLGDPGQLRTADVRFIVATNANLKEAVAQKHFREDLLFRINVLPVRLLPLCERPEEIRAWAEFMLQRRHRAASTQGSVRLREAAVQILQGAPWPGNLRQLDNIICRAYALALNEGRETEPRWFVEQSHIESALRLDSDEPPQLMSQLRRVASIFVDHALRHSGSSGVLHLEHTEVLRGLVLEEGLRRLGDLRKVFSLLGSDAAVRSRNHHRQHLRERSRVMQLETLLGAPPPRNRSTTQHPGMQRFLTWKHRLTEERGKACRQTGTSSGNRQDGPDGSFCIMGWSQQTQANVIG